MWIQDDSVWYHQARVETRTPGLSCYVSTSVFWCCLVLYLKFMSLWIQSWNRKPIPRRQSRSPNNLILLYRYSSIIILVRATCSPYGIDYVSSNLSQIRYWKLSELVPKIFLTKVWVGNAQHTVILKRFSTW